MGSFGKREKTVVVGDLGELGLIERLLSRFSRPTSDSVIVGPGDDAAVIELDAKTRLVVTTDMLVEGVHFRLDWSYPEALGFKSVTANLSDVAAMGGRPVGIVISLGLPRVVPVRAVDRMYRGISRALSMFGGDLLGGDTVRSSVITVSVTAIGVLAGKKPLLRSGARPGDKVCVTGSLGCSESGLMLLRKHFKSTRRPRKALLEAWADRTPDHFTKKLPPSLRRAGGVCISKHLVPSPRVKEARALSALGVSAMIDLSDGLSADLMQLARASGVGFVLKENDIPIDRHASAVAQALGVSPYRIAVLSGEEYEILFAIPGARYRRAASVLARRWGTPVTVVGDVTRDSGSVLMTAVGGNTRPLAVTGFRHF